VQEPRGGKIPFDYNKCDTWRQCVAEQYGAAIEMYKDSSGIESLNGGIAFGDESVFVRKEPRLPKEALSACQCVTAFAARGAALAGAAWQRADWPKLLTQLTETYRMIKESKNG
jgi:hypothetical protein